MVNGNQPYSSFMRFNFCIILVNSIKYILPQHEAQKYIKPGRI